MDAERKDDPDCFEELRGAQEIAYFYDMVNSPQPNSTEFTDEITLTSATKTIQSTLNPKSVTLTVSVGESSQRDSMCEVIKPQLVANPIKGVAFALVSEDTAKIQLSPVINLKQGCRLLSDSEVHSENIKPYQERRFLQLE